MLFEDAECKALAVLRLEHVVHREEVRTRIDLGIEAVAHGGPEERRLEERQVELASLSGLIALMQGSQDREGGERAAAHVGDREARARRRLQPRARERVRA